MGLSLFETLFWVGSKGNKGNIIKLGWWPILRQTHIGNPALDEKPDESNPSSLPVGLLVVSALSPFFWKGSPTKIDYGKKLVPLF